ncbi:MAG TPA: DISARM system helicase DrmA [Gemmatimonadaceae bacterium]|nr:DISARM system helicase DrmA [Gemmatimonadaceae bacterium]
MAASAYEIRDALVDALGLDLIGPSPGHPLESEVLEQSPSRWYLTGFLVPTGASLEQRSEEAGTEQPDLFDTGAGTDDEEGTDPPAARRVFLPSSVGVSLIVPGRSHALDVTVTWGDYRRVIDEGKPTGDWRRSARRQSVRIPVNAASVKPVPYDVPGSDGLRLIASVRPVPKAAAERGVAPVDARVVAIFLVNERAAIEDADSKDEAFAFQAALQLRGDQPFVARANLRGFGDGDWDEKVADLQYRDTSEYAVGHGIATGAVVTSGECREVRTSWVPTAEVERVDPKKMEDVELRMEALAAAESPDAVRTASGRIVSAYREWIAGQRTLLPAEPARAAIASQLLQRAEAVAKRIEQGFDALAEPKVFDAFRLANKVMAQAARQRESQIRQKAPVEVDAPAWRPFQLAFLLLNVRGLADPIHDDREVVDLLFFPTGGGKTEAYLGLAAFAMILRRLKNSGVSSAGVSVLMRYTLRLLTLDQLGRAATLICALELERKGNLQLGSWPFEIGLWVGQAATPNRMGRKGDNDRYSARSKVIEFKNNTRKPSPIPLETCPWCGARFTRDSFVLVPTEAQPRDLRISCVNRRCPFSGNVPLPILAVDEPIYRRLPAFLIATVDKFASLPWVGRTGALFGKVERSDADGFYGPCDPDVGRRLDGPLLPPDLIIQDELHLISGPLGTMVGLYETAIDTLSTRDVAGKRVRPKIVASTATVRRAGDQLLALFARRGSEVFPPPGPDRRDSFFAVTYTLADKPGRRYVGVAAQGRSLKVVLLRTYLALLGAAQLAWDAAGGARNTFNPADPYMTLVGYFSSLRELGGSRRIVEDEVRSRLLGYGGRRRVGEEKGLFASRRIAYEAVELTSRVGTSDVADTKRRLALSHANDEHIDVALATNMISVGLDIARLGLMVVLGQPKTSAEYIQATSRVGRDETRSGLVLTLLNVHRPRDRSHYERFAAYHGSFYRSVEATSVTPFSPRAIDRALPGVMVALARQGLPAMTAPPRALDIAQHLAELRFVTEALAERSECHARMSADEARELRARLEARVGDLFDSWIRVASEKETSRADLQYGTELAVPSLLHAPLDPELEKLTVDARKFRAHQSLRDVESNVNLWIMRPDGSYIQPEGEDA